MDLEYSIYTLLMPGVSFTRLLSSVFDNLLVCRPLEDSNPLVYLLVLGPQLSLFPLQIHYFGRWLTTLDTLLERHQLR
jgi:hypothetical protein